MLRSRFAVSLSLLAVALSLSAASLFAQEFSAEFVSTGRDNASSGPARIYVGKDKMRIEAKEGGELGMAAMIMDFASNKMLILMPQQKMYMESMPGMGPQKKDVWFRAVDANNACPQFEALAKRNDNSSVTCRKIGSDVVNGRPAVKYAGSSKSGSGYVWVDSKLRFPIKWQEKNSSGELRNIQEGAQPASLFEVPPDYHKFDMQQMMRQRQRP